MRKVYAPVCVMLCFALSPVVAQPRIPPPTRAPVHPAAPASARIQNSFTAVVNSQSWPAARKQEVLSAFKKLPAGMQQAVAASRDSDLARELAVPVVKLSDRVRGPVLALKLPLITDVWPASGDGTPNAWLLVYAMGVNPNCQVWFNGSARTTYYMPWGEDWGECVGCQIPVVPVAQRYDLYLKDTAANKSGGHKNYRVVAPRSWRGNHGWQFANFGEATIPWDCFRHYFGANEVEDGSGNHLPAAQAWYDGTYKGVGGGGNCFGMTLSAERFLFWQPWSLFESWWSSNRLPRAWDYDFVNEVHRSVNEHQGAQLEVSIMANKLWLRDNQDHNEAWERCRDLIGSLGSTNNPLLSIYGPGWGHCVWPYRTEEVGNTRRIYIYDNNVPYAESETSDTTTVVEINKTTGALTWGSATRTLCRSYADCTPADPHLPTEATDGDAALMTTIVVEKPARAVQIRDESGRSFYTGDQLNEDKATRIPASMLFIPDTGTKPDASFPLVYLFGNSKGKKLELSVSGVRGKAVRSFNPGLVFEVRPDVEKVDIILDKVLTNEVRLTSSLAGAGLIRTIMRVGPRQERVVDVKVLDAAPSILVVPSPDKSGVNVENASGSPVRFEIEVKSFQGGAMNTLSLPAQTLAAQTGALLSPTDWTKLLDLRMDLRNLRTGAAIRSNLLRRGP